MRNWALVAVLALLAPACGSGGKGALPNTVVVSTTSLPVATQGTPYSSTLAASGGTAPYTWTHSGVLPAGLGLSSAGVLSGTPGGTGLSTFTVQALDSASPPRAASRQLSLNVTTAGAQYDPSWASIAPTSTINFAYNGGDGNALMAAMNALTPGQRLVIAGGTYSTGNFFDLTCSGSAAAPITIQAATGAAVVFVQTNLAQNILDVGSGGPVRYLTLRGIEWTGGSEGVRFHDCANVWFDRNNVHDTVSAAVTANSHNTDHLYLTRNEVHHTGGSGEGLYLGANSGAVIMHDSVVALNHIHDTNGPSVTQGDGIELKQGSWGNWIAENLVHDCGFPCILVYGTAGQAQNIVERNTCYNSGDNAMQVQGECIVRNNLVMNGAGSAFASQIHQGNPTNLQVVHNTFINSGRAVSLSSWNAAANMVFANNVCYSHTSQSLQVTGGTTGVAFAGNVVAGSVIGAAGGPGVFTPTTNLVNPLADFTSVAWDASLRNALPVAACAIVGAGNATYAVPVDITGATRVSGLEAGCYDRP